MANTGDRQTPTPNNGSGGGFDFNQPTIISLLYLAGYVTGVTAIVGVVLGYIWKGEPKAEWEVSHYAYLIRTFWIGFIGSIIGFLLLIVVIGFLVLLAVGVLVIIRTVLSLINAQKQEPMPDPDSWLI